MDKNDRVSELVIEKITSREAIASKNKGKLFSDIFDLSQPEQAIAFSLKLVLHTLY
jgi:hypothetical protein